MRYDRELCWAQRLSASRVADSAKAWVCSDVYQFVGVMEKNSLMDSNIHFCQVQPMTMWMSHVAVKEMQDRAP